MVSREILTLQTRGKGTYEISHDAKRFVEKSGINDGIITVFNRHTSSSLVLMENADPSARTDLENFFDHLVPEGTPYFTHTYEGADDMPSHIRMALTRSSETIPVANGKMLLGTWQGLFLFEHRNTPHYRELVMTIIGE